MRPIFDRFPGLESRTPFLLLATLPTRVHRLDGISRRTGAEVWVKRDDETHPTMGGSKIRALEFFLPEAKSWRRPFIALGPEGSGWLLALARFGIPLGLDFTIATFPALGNPASRHKAELLRREAGRRLYRGADLLGFSLHVLKAAIRVAGGTWELAPVGGSDAISTAGYVNAALELAQQVERGECPRPDAIFVPVGSGGLTAGLMLGLAIAGLQSTIYAVSVAPRFVAGSLSITRLALQAAWALDWKDPAFAATRVLHRYKGSYGVATRASRAAAAIFREEEGIEVDPVFSAKCAAAMLEEAGRMKGQKLLFWATYRRPERA